jgi:hypothetical protein
MVPKIAVLRACGIESSTGMSGCEPSVSASVLNESAGTLCEIGACWESDATFTGELVESTQGLVEELVLSGRCNPPSKIEVSVGEIAGKSALFGESLSVRGYRVCITSKVTKAVSTLIVH